MFSCAAAATELYTLSLHDALPICIRRRPGSRRCPRARRGTCRPCRGRRPCRDRRSEEHTSELQSQFHLVCRLLLEKKNHEARYREVILCWPVPSGLQIDAEDVAAA